MRAACGCTHPARRVAPLPPPPPPPPLRPARALARRMGRDLNLFYTTVHERNINSVRLLVDTVIPVRYSPDFYKDLVRTPADFTKMGASIRHDSGGGATTRARATRPVLRAALPGGPPSTRPPLPPCAPRAPPHALQRTTTTSSWAPWAAAWSPSRARRTSGSTLPCLPCWRRTGIAGSVRARCGGRQRWWRAMAWCKQDLHYARRLV